MAQLNPNFEIDFNDINSYEQIQLIKDTQLAKENLLMHKAYKEPAEDEIIRNQFSSFTFVDFCPKLFTTGSGGGGGSLSRANSRPSSSARMASSSSQEYGERLDYERDYHSQSSPSGPLSSSRGSKSLRQHNYELETFSDLFDRINLWLKLNKDWRVTSMETLIFDCTSQFNHLKSSIQSSYLPKNMRGLRLYLSPSKSRFSGPQKIGCINVIPRKISGRYKSAGGSAEDGQQEQLKYENLDQILARLNELLLTRPIEGRILSVETITLPIVDGYVNTETNYFMDNRLNMLNERIYTHANTFNSSAATTAASAAAGEPEPDCTTTSDHNKQQQQEPVSADGVGTAAGQQPIVAQPNSGTNRLCDSSQNSHGLIGILRVYYEFGPMVCGLVNLIDFLPHLHLHLHRHRQQQQQSTREDLEVAVSSRSAGCENDPTESGGSAMNEQKHAAPSATTSDTGTTGIESSESLTRLVKRSLAWFELERKRILHETGGQPDSAPGERNSDDDDDDDDDDGHDGQDADGTADGGRAKWRHQHRKVDLKVCNLQVHHKIMLKGQLAKVSPNNVFETIRTRQMFHEPPREPIVCQQCSLASSTHQLHEWCQHLVALDQAYELKFVRLAYVVPVYNKYAASRLMSLCAPQPPPRSAPGSRKNSWRPPTPRAQSSSTADSGAKLAELDDGERSLSPAQLESGALQSINQAEMLPDDCLAKETGSTSPASQEEGSNGEEEEDDDDEDGEDYDDDDDDDLGAMEDALMEARDAAEQLAKEASLEIVQSTNERQRASELVHQLGSGEEDEQNSLIGQLTYRLFAPCQLVNSSSCFSINPVNSSSPLSRRGSVNLNGSGNTNTNTSLSSENAIPSTLLLPTGSGGGGLSNLSDSMMSINQQHLAYQGGPLLSSPPIQQQTISFGAFFPALSHDIIQTGAQFGKQASNLPGAGSGHFTTNEFEPVEAIKRRMEIYVTTNSMKVLAGETLVVNLSDQLSCLSTAIAETIVKASFLANRPPSTWVSVYILYAAVDEPHLPSQLLEQQRLRERLSLISEEGEEQATSAAGSSQAGERAATPSRKVSRSELRAEVGAASAASIQSPVGEDNMAPVFDDDFNTMDRVQDSAARRGSRQVGAAASNIPALATDMTEPSSKLPLQAGSPNKTLASLNQADGSIRVEVGRDTGASLYNSAYDRTVALPSQPDNQLNDYLEPVDFNLNPQQLAADGLWFDDENDLNAAPQLPWSHHHHQHGLISLTSVSVRAAQRQMRLRQSGATKSRAAVEKSRKKKSAKKLGSSGGHGEDSQCSVM